MRCLQTRLLKIAAYYQTLGGHASEGTWPCLHLNFRLLASRSVRQEISIAWKSPSLWHFVISALVNEYSRLVGTHFLTRVKFNILGGGGGIILMPLRSGRSTTLLPYYRTALLSWISDSKHFLLRTIFKGALKTPRPYSSPEIRI